MSERFHSHLFTRSSSLLFLQHHYPAHLLRLYSSFSLGLICFPPSVCHIRPGSSTPSTLSDFSPLSVFLSLLLNFSSSDSSIVSRYKAFPPLAHIPSSLHLLSYKPVPAVCRLHGFLSSSFRSCPLSYTSLSNLPFTLPLSPLLLLLPLSGNRCCLSDLIITG